MAASPALLEERVRQVVEAVTTGAPALSSAPAGPSVWAAGFWEALHGASDAPEPHPRSATSLQSLARCRRVALDVSCWASRRGGTPVRPSVHKRPRRAAANCASLPSRPTLDRSALQGALPPAKPGNTSGKLDRKLSKSFCALPALTRQASGVGALHVLGGSPAPQRSQFTRAHSMFVMPDRAAGGALQRTGSSTLQGMASGGSSPRGQQHPHPGATCCAKLQAMSLGADSPVAQPRVTQPVDQGGGS